MRKTILFTILTLAFVQSAFAESNILISDAWVREVPPGSNVSAGYMTFENTGNQPDILSAVSSDISEAVEIHNSSVDSKGMAKMEMIKMLELPAGEKVELMPGGMHLMLIGLKDSLVGKQSVVLTFNFEKSGNISIEVPVKSMKDSGEAHHH